MQHIGGLQRRGRYEGGGHAAGERHAGDIAQLIEQIENLGDAVAIGLPIAALVNLVCALRCHRGVPVRGCRWRRYNILAAAGHALF